MSHRIKAPKTAGLSAVSGFSGEEEDVIAAVATPAGTGAMAMVRLTGPGTATVLSRIFLPKKSPSAWQTHRMYHGRIHDCGEIKDEVLCCLMRGPRSYTREDTAEIYTHGGQAVVRAVLETVLKHGARPAEPGAFTKRAFMNGRLDLAQAEAVAEIINAKTDAARKAGLRQLGGGLSGKINGYREGLLQCLAHIALSIDYPEHESEAMNRQAVVSECTKLLADMRQLLETAKTGRILKEGVRTVIVGRPNVGKSSLLNAILREDRAIVTEIPGTTRDVLSEWVSVGGVPLRLSDTAGIRETRDPIERLGVMKTWEQAENADLLLFMADGAVAPQPEEASMLARCRRGQGILLLNKCDLPTDPGWAAWVKDIPNMPVIKLSVKDGTGMEALFTHIKEMFISGGLVTEDTDILTGERHKYLLTQAMNQLQKAAAAAEANVPEDLLAIDLTAAYKTLGEITGAEIGEDVLERIFSEFCVGK